MSSSRDEDRQQALSHHPQQDLVPPASRPSPPGDADAEDNIGSSQRPAVPLSPGGSPGSMEGIGLMPYSLRTELQAPVALKQSAF